VTDCFVARDLDSRCCWVVGSPPFAENERQLAVALVSAGATIEVSAEEDPSVTDVLTHIG